MKTLEILGMVLIFCFSIMTIGLYAQAENLIWAKQSSGNEEEYGRSIAILSSDYFTKITTGNIVNDGGWNQGCGWIDINNDGFLDLFAANHRNLGEVDNLLYLNNKNGTFTKITNDIIVTDRSTITATCWGDFNNDGYIDLFEAKNQEDKNSLYFNNGNGTFRKIITGIIVNEGGHSYGACCGDYDNDGDLDIFVAKGFGENNCLYSNNGDGTFTKVTSGIVVNDGGDSSDASWADYDNDGDLDLFVANWKTENDFLYKNNGNGTFTKIVTGEIVNDGSYAEGSSWGDYDNDGDLDLFVANYDNQKNLLYSNNGDGTFTKILNDPLVSEVGYFASGNWGDFDNDGDLDLVLIKDGSNCLYSNNGDGTFIKIDTTPISSEGEFTSGSTWGDYDNDGDLDLFCANVNNQNNYLYSNNGNSNHWINIKCIGRKSNVSAIGTKIRVKANLNGKLVWQLNEISGTGGRFGFNSLNAEFGLGNASVIDTIKIEWPSGIVQILTHVPVNQFLTIIEQSDNTPPTKPKNFQATPGDKKVTLSWSQNPESDLSHYQIYRSQLQGFVPAITDTLAIVMFPDNSYIDTEVINGQTYYYRISAVNVAGDESDYSAEASATPQAGITIPNIVISALEHNFGDVLLLAIASWQVVVENQGTANLQVTNVVSDNSVFSVNPNQFNIDPGSGHSVYIRFTPDSLQAERGTVTIFSNDPDQPEFKITFSGKGIDNQAPEIILPTPTSKMWVNADYLLTAQIKDNWAVKSASLFYRNGAQRNFQSLAMSQGQGENYLGAIPGSEVTFAGIAYFIKAEDSAGNTTISDTISQAIYFQDGVLSTSRIPCPYQAGYPRGEWHQISVPALLDQSGAAAVFNDETELGNYGEPNWRLFSYQDTDGDNITDGYVEFRSDLESSVFRFDSGKAFWLKANPEGAKIEIDVGAGHILPLAPQTIGLKPGWNQIGNPFAFPIAFSPNDSRIVNKLYLPDGSGGYQLTTTLQPWAGYFLFVNGNGNVDLKLAPKPGNPLHKTIADEAEWMFQINASCGSSKDEINYLGISETSADEWDGNDYPEPPAIGEYISLYFPHEDWQEECKNFTTDFRNSVGEGQVWNLIVTTNQKSSEVNLSWSQLIAADENLQFQLYDCHRNKTIDMESASEYRFSRLNQEVNSPFQILVGSREFVERQVAEIRSRLPNEFCLFQNYPNPFNSTTQIRFQLPLAEKVSLKILNVMGREVRALLNEHRAAGNYQLSWDGKDNQGNEAGTGVYLCVFQAGQFFESRKILLLK